MPGYPALAEFAVCNRQRRHDADHVAFEPAFPGDKTAFERRATDRQRPLARSRPCNLEAPCGANTLHHANGRMITHIAESGLQPLADGSGTQGQAFALDHFQRSQSGCGRERVGLERRTLHALWPDLQPFGASPDKPHWQAAASRFGQQQEIRNDAACVKRKERTGSRKACEDLIKDQGGAAGGCRAAKDGEEIGRRKTHACCCLHGFDKNAGKGLGMRFNRPGAGLRFGIRLRPGQDCHGGREGAKHGVAAFGVADREGTEAAPVIAAGKGNEVPGSSDMHGAFESGFGRFRPIRGGLEDGEFTRQNRSQGHKKRALAGCMEVRADMQDTGFELSFDRRLDRRMPMPERRGSRTTAKSSQDRPEASKRRAPVPRTKMGGLAVTAKLFVAEERC